MAGLDLALSHVGPRQGRGGLTTMGRGGAL
eukprot:COSAG06_NODE_45825_length_351_cov_3.329365_1_plen_29_part_10